eukprot:NODE_390_length_2555_cov_101.274260_g370_i0.p1 GENE.NODE_390_length_2555_cov_101.274260_g370_i0~~NODE_390_length_2555_cov_101.274260_g370_i0.p1  ORF type:complete len:731 (+),score=133.76 NODE_390_length_2555_cov_101.274260_g370_i0:148-2340(+)
MACEGTGLRWTTLVATGIIQVCIVYYLFSVIMPSSSPTSREEPPVARPRRTQRPVKDEEPVMAAPAPAPVVSPAATLKPKPKATAESAPTNYAASLPSPRQIGKLPKPEWASRDVIRCITPKEQLRRSTRFVDGEADDVHLEPRQEWGRNLIITTWFKVTREKSPFADKLKKQSERGDELGYLDHWYRSLSTLGLDAVILHNGWINATVQAMFETDKIKLWHMDIDSCCPSSPCFLTLLDWRWLVYFRAVEYFRAEYFLLTDGRDVSFRSSPFPFMRQISEYDLFFGSEYCPLSELGEISLPYKRCYEGFTDGTAPFAYNAGVVGGKLLPLRHLLHYLVHEILGSIATRYPSGAKDCDMAVMNHIIHTQIIQKTKYKIYTGLPFIKDPILKRNFKQGVFSGTAVSMDFSPKRLMRRDLASAKEGLEPYSTTFHYGGYQKSTACGNCSGWMQEAAARARPLLVKNSWKSPKWSAPPHCLMLLYAPSSWTWNITIPPKWGALVIFHEGQFDDEPEKYFGEAIVLLIKVNRDDFCQGCTAAELRWFLFYSYLMNSRIEGMGSDLQYVAILDRLTAINNLSPCEFVKNSRHYKFLWHIILFAGGRNVPMHYTPYLQEAYDTCYGSPIDGPSAFTYDPVLLSGMMWNVLNVLRYTTCELLCNITFSPKLAQRYGFSSAACAWPAFNHAMHDEKMRGQVWSAGLPIYNNQNYWKEDQDFMIEHKWAEDGPTVPVPR